MFRILTDDKYEDRWTKGVFVGKLLETDECIFLTSAGVGKSRTLKRLEPNLQYDLGFLNSCKGSPWNPTGKPEHNTLRRGDPLTAGTGFRRIYITDKILDKYGRTDGCPRCENFDATHNEECRRRIEQAMISAGDAFNHPDRPEASSAGGDFSSSAPGSGSGIVIPVGPEVEASPSVTTGRSATESAGSEMIIDSESPAAPSGETSAKAESSEMIIGMLAISGKLHRPLSDLSLDWKASRSTEFPYEEREAGRQKELDNIHKFDCVGKFAGDLCSWCSLSERTCGVGFRHQYVFP